MKNAPVNV